MVSVTLTNSCPHSRLTALQASSTASTTTPSRHAFERRVEDVKPMKRYDITSESLFRQTRFFEPAEKLLAIST
jgi:hypothetical protein